MTTIQRGHVLPAYKSNNGITVRFKESYLQFGNILALERKYQQRLVRTYAKMEPEKKSSISFGDQLLDYIEAGPKMRKWYGAPDQLLGDDDEEEFQEDIQVEGDQEDMGERDAILVTDADSETGQLVVLSLIVRRQRVRVLVRDAKAATAAFGPYVEPVVGDVRNIASLDAALKGVRAVICPTRVGALAERAKAKGVQHLVLLSQVGTSREGSTSFGDIFSGFKKRQMEQDEATVSGCGVPHTIVRAGRLLDEQGVGRLTISQGDIASGSITREGAAAVCVRALDAPPRHALVFEVVSGDEEVSDWTATFSALKETQPAELTSQPHSRHINNNL